MFLPRSAEFLSISMEEKNRNVHKYNETTIRSDFIYVNICIPRIIIIFSIAREQVETERKTCQACISGKKYLIFNFCILIIIGL